MSPRALRSKVNRDRTPPPPASKKPRNRRTLGRGTANGIVGSGAANEETSSQNPNNETQITDIDNEHPMIDHHASSHPAPKDNTTTKEFTSAFPSLTPENYEEQINNWNLPELRAALAEQKKNRTRHRNQTPTEIQNLVEIIRLGYEKQILMAALMAGVSEAVVWSLV